MSVTFAMIKPDATLRQVDDDIKQDIEEAGFIIQMHQKRFLTRGEAEWLYRDKQETSYFDALVDFTLSAPVVLLLLEYPSDDTPQVFRDLMGPYQPDKRIPGTIRHKYGLNTSRENSIHGSDSIENARLEIQKFFG